MYRQLKVDSPFTANQVKTINTAAYILAPLDIPINRTSRIRGGRVELSLVFGGVSSKIMSEEFRHLRGNNIKIDIAECAGYIHFWCQTFDNTLRELVAKTDDDIRTAITVADKHSGWRCGGAEILVSAYCAEMSQIDRLKAAEAIASAGIDCRDFVECQKAIGELNGLRKNLGKYLFFYVSPGTDFNVYLAQTEYPSVTILQVDEAAAPRGTANAKEVFAECKSEGQREALAMLLNIARVRHEFPDINGISIPPSALLVGMSGSGKSWIAKAFARMSRFPFMETTVSGWSPINSKSDSWSLVNVKQAVSESPIVLLVDEADKIGTRDGVGGNQNWYAGCNVELQNLLDRQMPDVPGGLTLMQKCHLSRSWIILAGAFQSIYRKKLGGEITLAEEVEGVQDITREDIEAGSGLTTELLNRVGVLVPVRGPSVAEYVRELKLVNDAVGTTRPAKELEAEASRAILEMRGWRGLSDYAVRAGCSALASRKSKN